jgi:hypothetical protein
MKETQNDARRRLECIYENTMSLYAALKDTSFDLRRAEYKNNGVAAVPIDFICDIEIKARRYLSTAQYPLWAVVLIDPESYKYVPERIRQTLGRVFEQNKLDMSGDYKKLYFMVKNQKLREELSPKEDLDGDESGASYTTD